MVRCRDGSVGFAGLDAAARSLKIMMHILGCMSDGKGAWAVCVCVCMCAGADGCVCTGYASALVEGQIVVEYVNLSAG